MKLSRRQVVLALFIVALIAGAVALRMRHGAHGTMQHAAHEKATYYCPMHPSYTSDRPGDCPICNMKLVKREERSDAISSRMEHAQGTAGSPYTSVVLAPEKKQRIGVKTAVVQRKPLHKTIRTVGQIAYDPELYQAQQEYLQALAAFEATKQGENPETLEQAKRLVEAASIRLRLLGLGDFFLQEMRGWKHADKALLLSDPQGRVWLYATIYEFELPLVQVGQKVQVEVPSIPGKVLEGTIQSIDAVLDPMTRSARARALLTDPEKILRPQMYVNVSLIVPMGEVLGVPMEAVMDSGTRRIVFVEREEGIFEPREVVVGVRADSTYEIKEGVSEGEKVVVSGNFLIDSESRLKSALEGTSTHAH